MRSILILLIAILYGCSMKNPQPVNESTSAIPVVVQDDSKYSMVHPKTPDRTVTVGGSGADIQGFTGKAIQTAIDAVNSHGGGTVLLLPGKYDIIAPVKLYDNIALKGSGPSTILRKCDGFRTSFVLDADYSELKATVADVSGFKVGMGIQLWDEKQKDGWDPTTAVITAIVGDTIYFDNYLVRDYLASNGGVVSNTCSVVSAVEVDNVIVSDLTVDGNRATNDLINGCRGGGVYLHKVHNALVENVAVKDFNSDGISFQVTEYVTVRNCEVSGCASLGIHPGTGTLYCRIENNVSHDNDDDGIYVCWRVQHGKIANNKSYRNGRNGISTGHKDTDNLFENNHIYENGSDGILLRNDGPKNSPHRSVFINNTVEDNGMKSDNRDAYGIAIYGPAEGIVIENNTFSSNGKGNQKAALFLDKETLPVKMQNNNLKGLTEVVKAN